MAVQYSTTTGVLTSGLAAGAARTMLEITPDASTPGELVEISISNMAATGYTIVEFCTYTATGTGTASTWKRVGAGVGVARTTGKFNDSVEPTGGAAYWVDIFANPFSLSHLQWPLGRETMAASAVGAVMGVRITTSVAPDATHPFALSLLVEE